MGHALGLGHPNLASESGLGGSDTDLTQATPGPNGIFDLDRGSDRLPGTADDLRGDDVNLNWFSINTNDPFTLPAIVDSSTFSRDVSLLPAGDTASANGGRSTAAGLGLAFTESVMQQGTFPDEAQRTLTADDVAGIRFARAGFDRIQGTSDDYNANLEFVGLTSQADILISFSDGVGVDFAATLRNGAQLTATDFTITSSSIVFNSGGNDFDWFFNDILLPPPGDIDGNGVVDSFDVDDFERLRADPQDFAAANPDLPIELVADLDGSGVVDAFDVDDFERLLAQTTAGIPVPTPASAISLLLTGALPFRRRRVARAACPLSFRRRRVALAACPPVGSGGWWMERPRCQPARG